VKTSKRQRKYVNAMRAMSEVPWPARRFKYPATLGPWGKLPGRATHPGRCRFDRFVRRAEEVTARVVAAQGELERRQEQSRRALEAARKRERRENRSLRGFISRLRRSR
jgi:hypothetical protein